MSPCLVAYALIDDDPLIHRHWKSKAKGIGLEILACFTEDEFLKHNVEKVTPVYVDKNLGDGISGLDVTKRFFEIGYPELFITTGERNMHSMKMPYLKGIVGKDFPLSV